MRVGKTAAFFDKIFNLVFLLSFSVSRWNFGILWFFSTGGGGGGAGGVTVGRMDIN